MGNTSYYLYQKYIKIGNQDWIPNYPNVWSVDGDGTMPLVVKSIDDPTCGYIPPSEPIYRWIDVDPTKDWICDDCPGIKDYFATTALEDMQIMFTPIFDYDREADDYYIYYSLDSGYTWNKTWVESGVGVVTPVLHSGDTVFWKASGLTVSSDYGIGGFEASYSKHYNISGNILSLVYGDDFENNTTISNDYQFKRMFYEKGVVNASGLTLPANVTPYCYEEMFYSSALVTPPPVLPALNLAEGCYMGMLRSQNLTTAPTICATTMATSACTSMFEGCTSLTTAPELPATTLAPYCYLRMFNYCRSLQAAPTLPATALTEGCYSGMFNRCSGITSIALPARDLVQGCYTSICSNCTNLNDIKCWATTGLNYLQYSEAFARVASNGTFYKIRTASYPSNVIPSGWTIQYVT